MWAQQGSVAAADADLGAVQLRGPGRHDLGAGRRASRQIYNETKGYEKTIGLYFDTAIDLYNEAVRLQMWPKLYKNVQFYLRALNWDGTNSAQRLNKQKSDPFSNDCEKSFHRIPMSLSVP